ncbi:UNVERIFIED_CONTAM: hypothetical protein GTU68_008110 [Idotea baltica]|nr:hypothetical protein [Idotea baltica]
MSIALVKELRERTGLGMMECKKALKAAGDDVEKAIEELRKSSGMKAAKKAGRTAADGVVVTRISDDGSYGVLVEVNSETDFAAKNEGFLVFVANVAMHIAAVNPQVVSPADMPAEALEKEKEIYTAQAQESGKPAEIIEKMIGGRLKKFMAENSLIEQAFVKDPDITVGKLVSAAGAEVVSFARFEVGEGIEVEKIDFADEVAAQLGAS